MSEVDAKLTSEGADIPSRPLLAGREISMRFMISIPLAGTPETMPPELRAYFPLSEAIRTWYDDHYGDRLKVDPCPGSTVVRLDGDLYLLRVPLLFGETHFVTSRKFIPNPGITRGPAICNVVQLVQDLKEPRALRLSESALEEIQVAVQRALPAIYTLENTCHDLTHIALGDVATAVANLMVRNGRYGESKWASLQAAEKTLKAAIALEGATFAFTHGLKGLFAQLAKTGIQIEPKPYVDAIQCSAGIRYGEEKCTPEEALDAHRRSLDLVNELAEGGAKFETGLG